MGILSKRRDEDEWGNNTYWDTSSKKDPRFNMSGSSSGIFAAQSDMDRAIRAKAAQLGVEPPDDIDCGACKT